MSFNPSRKKVQYYKESIHNIPKIKKKHNLNQT